MELHESVRGTLVKATVKQSEGFRVRMERWEVVSPKGLFSINLINETLDEDGTVTDTSTYSYFMTREELTRLTDALTQ